jgi:transcriptional regulator with XRE-family HTH domain
VDVKKEMGQKLKRIREAVDLSQQDVADKLGLSKVAYGDFERGRTAISPEYLIRLSQILNVPVTAFFPDEVLSDEDMRRAADPSLRAVIAAWPHVPQWAKDIIIATAERTKITPEAVSSGSSGPS